MSRETFTTTFSESAHMWTAIRPDSDHFDILLSTLEGVDLSTEISNKLLLILADQTKGIDDFAKAVNAVIINPESADLSQWTESGTHETPAAASGSGLPPRELREGREGFENPKTTDGHEVTIFPTTPTGLPDLEPYTGLAAVTAGAGESGAAEHTNTFEFDLAPEDLEKFTITTAPEQRPTIEDTPEWALSVTREELTTKAKKKHGKQPITAIKHRWTQNNPTYPDDYIIAVRFPDLIGISKTKHALYQARLDQAREDYINKNTSTNHRSGTHLGAALEAAGIVTTPIPPSEDVGNGAADQELGGPPEAISAVPPNPEIESPRPPEVPTAANNTDTPAPVMNTRLNSSPPRTSEPFAPTPATPIGQLTEIEMALLGKKKIDRMSQSEQAFNQAKAQYRTTAEDYHKMRLQRKQGLTGFFSNPDQAEKDLKDKCDAQLLELKKAAVETVKAYKNDKIQRVDIHAANLRAEKLKQEIEQKVLQSIKQANQQPSTTQTINRFNKATNELLSKTREQVARVTPNAWIDYYESNQRVRKVRNWVSNQENQAAIGHWALRLGIPAAKVYLLGAALTPTLIAAGFAAGAVAGTVAGIGYIDSQIQKRQQVRHQESLAQELSDMTPDMLAAEFANIARQEQKRAKTSRWIAWAKTGLAAAAGSIAGHYAPDSLHLPSWHSAPDVPAPDAPTTNPPPELAEPLPTTNDSLSNESYPEPVDTTTAAGIETPDYDAIDTPPVLEVPGPVATPEVTPETTPPQLISWESFWSNGTDVAHTPSVPVETPTPPPFNIAEHHPVTPEAQIDLSGTGAEHVDSTYTEASAGSSGVVEGSEYSTGVPYEAPIPEIHGTMIDVTSSNGFGGFTGAFDQLLGGITADSTPEWFNSKLPLDIAFDGAHYDLSGSQLGDFARQMGLINLNGESIVIEPGDQIGFVNDRLSIIRNGITTAITDNTGNPLGGLAGRGFDFKKY